MANQAITTNKRVAKNTIFLFMRTIIIMGITLYTSRVILSVLGVDDYGIYNVVGGVVAMLSFLSGAMVQASQRYLSFAQGEGNIDNQKKVFSTSILIHATIAIVVLIIMETIGLWYVNTKMVLPPERLLAANAIFQFAILAFICRILVVPFNASVVAHERMHIYAYISIADAVMQLLLVLLLKIVPVDKLILYGGFMFGVAVFNWTLYFLYCKFNFRECVYIKTRDWNLFKEMLSFASWAFLGGFGFIARDNGVNLVINAFCGPAVNAARAVAYQVTSAVQTFVASFQQALNPQITKRYAAGNVDSMMDLVKIGSKYTGLALIVCCTPIIIRSDYVLKLWLGTVPDYAPQFLQLALIMSIISSMGNALNTAMQATGNLKLFQIVVSIIMCIDVPLAYLLLRSGIDPYMVICISIITSFICLIAKLLLLRKLVSFSVMMFAGEVIIRSMAVGVVGYGIINYISKSIPVSFVGFLLLCIITLLVYSAVILALGTNKSERTLIRNIFKIK